MTGEQPIEPTVECYQTATFNNDTCQWDVMGEQPTEPTVECYQTATFNTDTCQWDMTGEQPTEPTIECYQTATFNTDTCQWDLTGEQPTEPTVECYQTATFNTDTCQWDVTGEQPTEPTVECYQTATFNTNTCQWDVTGEQLEAGNDGTLTVCEGTTPTDAELFEALTGADTGGTWSGPVNGVYTYTITSEPCPEDTATVTVTEEDCEPPTGCETAFARYSTNNTCFIDDGFQRWGWINFFSATGTYNMELYAGAGQCDLTKGEQSGNVEVVWESTTVTVTINLLSGFIMKEAHLYIGSNDYPVKQQGQNFVETVAPGSYPYNSGPLNDLTTYTFEDVDVSEFTEGIYIIVHAVTCNEGDTISSKQQTTVKAYPTVFKNNINLDIEVPKATKGKISLYGMNGGLIQEVNKLNLRKGLNKITISTSNLSGSMYFLMIRTVNGDKIVKKIIAER